LNDLARWLAVAGLAIAMVYPFMKRWTYLPQVVLGAAFSWGIVMAFAAVQNQVTAAGWLFFIASVLWIVAYDTLYAMVDREDDLKAIPTVSLVMDWNDMFGSTGIYPAGEGVPRATSFEYFDPIGGVDGQVNASVEIQGGSSTGRWKTDKISMRVRFREPYGPTKLNLPILEG